MKIPILLLAASTLAGSMATYTACAASDSWTGASDGLWSTTNNWSSGTQVPGDTTGGTTSTDIAIFNATSINTTVTVDSFPQNIGGISFSGAAANYTIGGNPLTMSSGSVIEIPISLTSINAFEEILCPLSIAGASGTLTIANNSANGSGAGAGTLTISGDVTGAEAGSTMLTLEGSNANTNTVSGAIQDGTATVGVTKNGAGTWIASGANTFTGPVVVNDGTLQFAAMPTDNTALTLSGGTLSVVRDDSVITLNSPGTTGAGKLELVGTGTDNLNSLGASFDGDIVITASPVKSTPLLDNLPLSVLSPNGTLDAFGSAAGATTINNLGDGIIYVRNPSANGAANAQAENFVINAGSGLVSFGPNTGQRAPRTGNIQINAGVLLMNNGGAFTTNSGVISGPGTVSMILPGDVFTGPNTYSGGTWVGMGTNLNFSGQFNITAGITVVGNTALSGGAIESGPLGTGPVVFNPATSTFLSVARIADPGPSGLTTTLHNSVIQRNTVNICSQILNGAGNIVDQSTYANTMIFTDDGLTVPSTWTLEPCPVVWSNQAQDHGNLIAGTAGSQTPQVSWINVNAAYTAQIDQVIREDMHGAPGHMSLRKLAPGTLRLGRQNTYGGLTIISQGAIEITVDDALPTSTILGIGGGTWAASTWPELGIVGATQVTFGQGTVYGRFELNGFNQTVAGLAQSGNSSVPANNIITNSSATTSTFTVDNANSYGVGCSIGGNLNLVKNNGGRLAFANPLRYVGNTTINAGTLAVSSANPNDDLSRVTIASSGATNELNFVGTDTVKELYIGATLQPAGVYGAIGSGAQFEIEQITGTGTLTVTTGSVTVVPQAVITSVGIQSATNVVLTATNGAPSGPYSLLSSVALTNSVANWETNATGAFDVNGNTTITNGSGTNTTRFYLIRQP